MATSARSTEATTEAAAENRPLQQKNAPQGVFLFVFQRVEHTADDFAFGFDVGEEELFALGGVDHGDGLDLVEDDALLPQRFAVVPIGLVFENQDLRAVEHAPAAVLRVLFVDAMQLFVEHVDELLSLFFGNFLAVLELGEHHVARRLGAQIRPEGMADELQSRRKGEMLF